MPWVRALFKERKVWALADASGKPLEEEGRTPIRYSEKAGATIYRAGASRIRAIPGAEVQELPEGSVAEPSVASPRTQSRPGAKGSGFGSAGRRTVAQSEAARQSAQETLASLPEGTHVVFTDGACVGNPGPAGAGAVLRCADGRTLEEGLPLGEATNNVGELSAIGLALDLLERAGVSPEEPVALFTDSKYSRGVLTEGWKARSNTELILELRSRLEKWTGLSLHWVAGHVGIPENERADELASDAARRQA
jgi:ribonuclease HI